MTTRTLPPVRLGHIAGADERTLKLGAYSAPDTHLAAPARCDYLDKVRHWPMLANDRVGDCEVAAGLHQAQAWTADNGTEFVPTDAEALEAYSAITGYDPATGQPDDGMTSLALLNRWRGAGLGGHKIDAFAAVNIRNIDEVKWAVSTFGGLLVALAMPVSAQAQTADRKTWRITDGPDAEPGSWGGHAVYLGAYTSRTATVITWGAPQSLTWSWWGRYAIEAYAPVSVDWVGSDGKTSTGLDLDTLLADAAALTAH